MITRRQFAITAAGFAAGLAISRDRKGWAQRPPIRVAVSMDTLAGANVNDARAAFRVWGEELAQRLAMRHAEMANEVFIPSAQLIHMIRQGEVDCFALTALEYASVTDFLDPNYALIENYAVNGMEYFLLVPTNSPYKKIEDLKGTKLLLQHHRDTAMMRTWLSIALANVGCPDVEQFFDSPEMHEQIPQVILPVFFHKAQAAAISRRAFDMAVELNPQLGRELRVIATSPKVIPDGFWFRKGCDIEDARAFQQSVLRLDSIPSGRQVLALYQSTGFVQRSCSIMNATVDLIHQYQRIHKRNSTKQSG